MYRHAGPAGSMFCGIEHAGKHTLKNNCDNYPQTTNSYILPPLFISKYPEGHDHATTKPQPRVTPPLSADEEKKYQGICSGQGGEQTEYKVFNLFTKLLEEQQDHSTMLVLRDFGLSTKGKTNFKRTTLMSEFPQIQTISMRGQSDYVVLLKGLGYVVIEVKRTLNVTSLQKAKDQLDRSEIFLNQLLLAVAPNSHHLPILKLIMFEMDDPQYSLVPNSSAYHFFECKGNSAVAFKDKWKDIKQELRTRLPPNPVTPLESKRIARVLTGLWSMKSQKRQPYFDVNDASVPHLTTQIDEKVNHAYLSSNTTAPAVTNVIDNQQGTVFRDSNGISLIYLTPEQMNVYNNVPRGIIRGPAGAGKTLLVLFKIIELVQSQQDSRKILLIVPYPHTIRCKNILEENNVVVVDCEELPPKTPHDVVVMDIIDFFKQIKIISCHRNEHDLKMSDISTYHFFIDDFQSYTTKESNYIWKGLIKRVYEMASHHSSYFWCMTDKFQFIWVTEKSKKCSISNFKFGESTERTTIPTYFLTNILRNTEEILKVFLAAEIKQKSLLDHISTCDTQIAHKITSSLPTYHVLMDTNSNDPALMNSDDNYDFVIERLEDELRQFLCVMNRTKCPSDIAILHGQYVFSDLEERTREMISRTFNIIPMSVADQLKTKSSTIVLDDITNVVSGEWPVVILLFPNAPLGCSYVGFSRARTRLIMISNYLDHVVSRWDVELVQWKKENNHFVQL